MPLRLGCLPAQSESNATQGNTNLPTKDPIAHAMDRMAEVIQYLTKNTRCGEHRPVNEGDQTLEGFLKFYPLQYFGKPDSEQEAETWIDQMRIFLLH
jgi:hypothetical protein